MTETHSSDVVVIGGGPAGYVAAIRAAQRGLDVVLVEKDAYGGTCLNRGCIPSKALISAARTAYDANMGGEMGVNTTVSVDFDQLQRWKDRIVRRLTKGVEKLCKGNGVELLSGTAEFVDTSTVRVHNGESTVARVSYDSAIVASGSRPIELPGFEFDTPHVLDAKQALELEELPDRLLVVGAGYIGMELSFAYAMLGVNVTVVEALESILPTYPEKLVQPVQSHAEQLGIDFHFGHVASECEQRSNGIRVTTDAMNGDEQRQFEVDKALVAVGREPVTDTLQLDAIGLDPNEDGFIETDEQCRTAVEHVYAVGDVSGNPMLAHAGSHEGEVAADVIAGDTDATVQSAIPAVVFTTPEIASVGLSESEATEQGYDVTVGEFPLRASGRALTTGQSDGVVRLIADSDTNRVLGSQIVGPEASEVIAEVGLAVTQELTVSDVCETIHAHPTLAEGVMEAAGNVHGEAIHTLNR